MTHAKGCNSALFSRRAGKYETYLSAVEDAPQAHPWVSRAYAHPRRTRRDTRPPCQGARKAKRLNAGTAGARLPRAARLLRREQFTQALAEGATGVRRYFTLFARPNGLSQARIGIIASKKVMPRAVDRNRAKRLVRETFRQTRRRLPGVDVVVQVRRCPPRAAGAAARAELGKLLSEISARSG